MASKRDEDIFKTVFVEKVLEDIADAYRDEEGYPKMSFSEMTEAAVRYVNGSMWNSELPYWEQLNQLTEEIIANRNGVTYDGERDEFLPEEEPEI